MKVFVRVVGLFLLLSSTAIFILKIKFIIPVSYKEALILFIIGAICFMWANKGNDKEERIRRF